MILLFPVACLHHSLQKMWINIFYQVCEERIYWKIQKSSVFFICEFIFHKGRYVFDSQSKGILHVIESREAPFLTFPSSASPANLSINLFSSPFWKGKKDALHHLFSCARPRCSRLSFLDHSTRWEEGRQHLSAFTFCTTRSIIRTHYTYVLLFERNRSLGLGYLSIWSGQKMIDQCNGKNCSVNGSNCESTPFHSISVGQNRGTIKLALLHFLLAGMGGPSSIQSYVVLKDLIAVCWFSIWMIRSRARPFRCTASCICTPCYVPRPRAIRRALLGWGRAAGPGSSRTKGWRKRELEHLNSLVLFGEIDTLHLSSITAQEFSGENIPR